MVFYARAWRRIEVLKLVQSRRFRWLVIEVGQEERYLLADDVAVHSTQLRVRSVGGFERLEEPRLLPSGTAHEPLALMLGHESIRADGLEVVFKRFVGSCAMIVDIGRRRTCRPRSRAKDILPCWDMVNLHWRAWQCGIHGPRSREVGFEFRSLPLEIGSLRLEIGSLPLEIGSLPLEIGSLRLELGTRDFGIGAVSSEFAL